jgi:hypothetical protein
MIRQLLSLLFFSHLSLVFGQDEFGKTEFTTHDNGLMYSVSTMEKLSAIADSLNLKYLQCDLDRTYYSKQQGEGIYFVLKGKKAVKLAEDLDNGVSFDEIRSKYPSLKMKENLLVIKYQMTNTEDGKPITSFEEAGGAYYGKQLSVKKNIEEVLANSIQFSYSPETRYSEEEVIGFFFPNGMQSTELPEKYARIIQYADCLVDTNTVKLRDNAEMGHITLPNNFENLSQKKKEKLLEEFRSTQVIGFCSMDDGPRIHAVNIALLSAETGNWGVFLRAHLDIMNDNFERMSDGSYAWGERLTYIKELEELNIDVLQLIFGISLRVENASRNHYYGSIGRLGRALSETANPKEVEMALLLAISDTKLDDYNRLLAYYMITSYTYHLTEESQKAYLLPKIESAIKTLPNYLQQYIKEE